MDNTIDRLVNPPWLESFRRFERQTNIAALAFQESEAMLSMKKLSEITRSASLAFNESELMKSARNVAENSRLASLAFHESDAMASIREFAESSKLASLAFHESEAMRSFRTIAESTRLSTIMFQQSEAAKQLQDIAKTSQLASIALQQSEAFNQLLQFRNLASFKALANLDNTPFPDRSVLAFTPKLVGSEAVDESLIEIDSQISEEIASTTDFNALSEKTKSILLYIYHNYFLPVFLSCLSAYMMTNAVEARKVLESVSTPAEVKTFIRSPNTKFDKSALKGFRVTTAHSLNFREAPNMKSEIITKLPIGTLIEVIDKSSRSWLLVETEIDGALEQGWISRRYTVYFK